MSDWISDLPGLVDLLAGLRPSSPSTSYFGSTHSLKGQKEPKLALKMMADADRFHTNTGQMTGHKQNWHWKDILQACWGVVPKLNIHGHSYNHAVTEKLLLSFPNVDILQYFGTKPFMFNKRYKERQLRPSETFSIYFYFYFYTRPHVRTQGLRRLCKCISSTTTTT